MENLMRKFNLSFLGMFLFSAFVLFTATSAFAVPIAFDLGLGGTVTYAGGNSAFVTTNGAVTGVGNGTTSLSISGGSLNFSTGKYTGGTSSAAGFTYSFACV